MENIEAAWLQHYLQTKFVAIQFLSSLLGGITIYIVYLRQ